MCTSHIGQGEGSEDQPSGWLKSKPHFLDQHNFALKGQNYLFLIGEDAKFACPFVSLSWPRGISAKLNFNSERPAPHPPHKPCLQLNLQILTTILFSGSAVFYWYIQPCWCEYMFISLSIIKIRKDSFDIVQICIAVKRNIWVVTFDIETIQFRKGIFYFHICAARVIPQGDRSNRKTLCDSE